MKYRRSLYGAVLAVLLISGCTGEFWRETRPPAAVSQWIREEENQREQESSTVPDDSSQEMNREETPQAQEALLPEGGEQLYSYERMTAELELLQKLYPEWIRLEWIGTTVQGRDIPAAILGSGEQEALYIAAIHGCEFSTVNFIMRCLREYVRAADAHELYGSYDIAGIVSRYTLYIVPMANPDGYEISNGSGEPEFDLEGLDEVRGEYSTNANGVNLNRNFPFEWEDAIGSDRHEYSASKGTAPGSEPETQALMALCEAHDFIQMFSFHNYGYCVYWRDAVNGEIEGDEDLLGQLWANCGFYGQEETVSAEGYAGGFENWFRRRFARPGLCVELGLTQYAPAEYIEHFEEAIVWEDTRLSMLQGLE